MSYMLRFYITLYFYFYFFAKNLAFTCSSTYYLFICLLLFHSKNKPILLPSSSVSFSCSSSKLLLFLFIFKTNHEFSCSSKLLLFFKYKLNPSKVAVLHCFCFYCRKFQNFKIKDELMISFPIVRITKKSNKND